MRRPVRRPGGLRLVRSIAGRRRGQSTGERHPKTWKNPSAAGAMKATSRPSGETASPGASCLGGESMPRDARRRRRGPAVMRSRWRSAALLATTATCLLSGIHSAWLTSASTLADQSARRALESSRRSLIDARHEHHRSMRRSARVRRTGATVRRATSAASRLRRRAREQLTRRGGASPTAGRSQHVIGLILVRVERDPLAVGRPAERLILRYRRVHDRRRQRRRVYPDPAG